MYIVHSMSNILHITHTLVQSKVKADQSKYTFIEYGILFSVTTNNRQRKMQWRQHPHWFFVDCFCCFLSFSFSFIHSFILLLYTFLLFILIVIAVLSVFLGLTFANQTSRTNQRREKHFLPPQGIIMCIQYSVCIPYPHHVIYYTLYILHILLFVSISFTVMSYWIPPFSYHFCSNKTSSLTYFDPF